jgi:Mrp family chromosome partitioning ATPase
MLFDMPPLLVNDDTIGFLRHVDCAMVVAAAEHTSVKEIDECERELASHTNVLGVVLNKCRFTGRKYGYDYYYS